MYPSHWRAFFILLLLGAGTHLLIYGTDSQKPNGLRERILPEGRDPDYGRAVLMEIIYGLIFFCLMVIPYRLIANPTQSLPDLIFWEDVVTRRDVYLRNGILDCDHISAFDERSNLDPNTGNRRWAFDCILSLWRDVFVDDDRRAPALFHRCTFRRAY